MKKLETPPEIVQVQDEITHMQEELEEIRTYARGLFLQNKELHKRLDDLAFVENSRTWRLLKYMRVPLRVLLVGGPATFISRARSWLGRNRGHYLQSLSASKKPSPPAYKVPPTDWSITQQHLPDASNFSGVSIVIPVFNALDYAQACIESIYRARVSIPFEVIVVDNGSRPEVKAWLAAESQKRERFFFICLSHNLGFSKAMNLGIQKARGQYIVLHNSDTVVTSGWLDLLVRATEQDPQIGIVSPVTNYVGEGSQIDDAARGITAKQAERHATKIRNRDSLLSIPERLVFFSVLIKRRVIEVIGGLDEGFGLGNFEDEDFCLRTRLAGFTLAIARNAFVYHHGSKTFTANNISHTSWMDGNKRRYLDKVSTLSSVFPPHQPRSRAREQVEVSVIVRTCNRPGTLRVALASLANQTFDAFEVVLVNDGGQDVSELLQEFEQYFSITHIKHAERKGPGAALNAGVRAAQGKWIAYLDDDDIIYPYHLEELWTALTRTEGKYQFAYGDYNRALVDGHSAGATTIARLPISGWKFKARDLYANNYLPLHTWMHTRALFEKIGGFDEDLIFFEDWDFLLRAARQYPFLHIQRMTCEYRFYLDSSNSMVKQRERRLEQLNIIYNRYPARNVLLNMRRQRMRKGVELQIAQIERLKEAAEHKIFSNKEAQQQILSIVVGLQAERGSGEL